MIQLRYRPVMLLAVLIQVGACQIRPPGPSAAQNIEPGAASIPDGDVREGVKAFRSTYLRSGMAGVNRNVAICQNAVAQHAPVDTVRQCLSFEMAALIVTAAHDSQRGAQPLPNLSKTDFTRRFDFYFAAMGVPPALRGAEADALFRRVSPLVQPS